MRLLLRPLKQRLLQALRRDVQKLGRSSLITILFTYSASSWSAPHPGMGSSILANPKTDLAFLSRGYRFGLIGTPWKFSKLNLSSEKDRFSLEVPELNSASIEILALNKKTSLKSYIQKSNRDYYHFGFEIRGKRELDLPQSKMVLIDLYHRKENKHLRQMILEAKKAESPSKVANAETNADSLTTKSEIGTDKNSEATSPKSESKERPIAIITCKFVADQKDSIKNCNDLGSLFSWISQKDVPENSSLSEPRSESPSP